MQKRMVMLVGVAAAMAGCKRAPRKGSAEAATPVVAAAAPVVISPPPVIAPPPVTEPPRPARPPKLPVRADLQPLAPPKPKDVPRPREFAPPELLVGVDDDTDPSGFDGPMMKLPVATGDGASMAPGGTESDVARAPADFKRPVADPDNVMPEYPAAARDLGLESTVALRLTIDASGAVIDAKVVRGEPPFTEAALAAARRWRFTPARIRDLPVATTLVWNIRFQPPD